jgi:dipeptidase E
MTPFGKIGYIPNALDFSGVNTDKKSAHIQADVASLRELELQVEGVDLKNYFNKSDVLRGKLNELGAIFISGGNVFVLRQAMRLSGLDDILQEYRANEAFVYAGYSAAGCVLSPSLKAYAIVDQPDTPYPESKEIIWEGLGLIDFAFMPHFDSDHPESADIDKEIEYCRQKNIPFQAIRDGEVIILED